MKKIIIWTMLGCLIALSLVSASCTTDTTPAPTQETTEPSSSPTATGETNWWDSMGEPEYGGTINLRAVSLSPVSFDPNEPNGSQYAFWFESLFSPDWTVDRDTWSFPCNYIPEEYISPLLAESWEWVDSQTITVKLREGIHWWDKAPVNGRELTAEDVQYSYDRMLGTGSGFTEPNPYWASAMPSIERVVAVDTYTVEFKLKEASYTALNQVLNGQSFSGAVIIPHEWVEQGDTQNWETAVGTGPWELVDYEPGVSLTYNRYANYWCYDERHPENQLPYADAVKYITITDTSTAIASLRTGKIDMITDQRAGAITRQQAESLAKTNPDIIQATYPMVGATLDMRCDIEPFTDINVRKALQMAVNRDLIAETYYAGMVDGIPCGLIPPYYEGWTTPYDEWSAELQAEYSFDQDGAKALLADAGYPDGFDTNIIADGSDVNIEALEIVKSQFADIGVELEIKTMESGTFRPTANAGNFDGMVLNSRMAFPVAPAFGLGFYTSTNSNNWSHNNDTYFDELVNQLNNAATSDEAKAASREADMYLVSQHWGVNVCTTVGYNVWQPYLKGYSGEVFGAGSWNSFLPTRMWIDQTVKESM